jgi:preprotein translocase subunit SecG
MAATQIIAWGTTFYLPSVLERQIGGDLGIGRDVVFGGVTVMLLVAAVTSRQVGRFVDVHGARWPMSAGAIMLAIGLVILGASQGALSYLAAWLFIGLGVPLCMSLTAFAAMAQAYPERGRAGITTLMLFGGLASGILWPITGWLDATFGWRMTCLIFAALQLCIALPIFVLLLDRRTAQAAAAVNPEQLPAPALLLPHDHSAAFWLLVIGGGASGIVSWGLPLYFIPMFKGAGLETGAAITLASMQAYFTVLARAVDLGFAKSIGGMRLVSVAALVSPFCFVLLIAGLLHLPSGWMQIGIITLAMALYGFATGMIAAGRATLPLELFGAGGYGATMGKLLFWLNLMFAASPLLFALIHDGLGKAAALWIALAGSCIAALAYWRLERLVVAARTT